MSSKSTRSLSEMAADAVSNSDTVICPKCHCQHFETYKTIQGSTSTFRYKSCRKCGHRILTNSKTTEKIVRGVRDSHEESGEINDGSMLLKMSS